MNSCPTAMLVNLTNYLKAASLKLHSGAKGGVQLLHTQMMTTRGYCALNILGETRLEPVLIHTKINQSESRGL